VRHLPVPDDVQLVVVLHGDGSFGIHHDQADVPAVHIALRRLAEQTVNAATRAHFDRLTEVQRHIRVEKPESGQAVLACACGAMLDADDMQVLPPSLGESTYVRPIVCKECAA